MTTKLQQAADADGALPPAPEQNLIAKPLTGDYRKDELLDALNQRWNADQPVGSATRVTFSFGEAPAAYSFDADNQGFLPFSAEQRGAVREVLAAISQLIAIDFVEIADGPSSYGQLRFANNKQSDSAGYAYLPGSTESAADGDVFIDIGSNEPPTSGNYAYATVVHEIGHALGLKHPGNYNGSQSDPNAAGNFLNRVEDSTVYTVMSYRQSTQFLQADGLAMFDVLTLRYLYGPRAHRGGDDVYALSEADGRKLTTLVDDGGNNTIDLSALATGAIFSLMPGSVNSVGSLQFGGAALNNVMLALDTSIERLIGGGGADVLSGNAGHNWLQGGAADDQIDGGAGIDTAAFAAQRAGYSVTRQGSDWVVSDNAGRDGVDTLAHVERLAFADGALALDLEGHAGSAAKALGALFGKAVLGDKAFVGQCLVLLDAGTTYAGLLAQLVASERFAAFAGSHSNTHFVQRVYENVVGVAPGAAALADFVALLDSGAFTQASLALVASDIDLNQAQIGLVGLANTGLEYLPG